MKILECNMKKYCIFAAQFLPHMGGVENYTYNISKELIKRGNKVIVVTNNTTGSVTREKMEGIEILRFPCFNLINGRFPIPKLNREFWKIHCFLKKQSYDLVVINARFYIHSIYAAIYAKKKKLQSICIEHGTSHLSVHNEILDMLGGMYEHLHTEILKWNCKDYYGVSKACCEWSEHFGIKSKGVLYNSVDLDRIEQMKEKKERSFRKEFDIPKEKKVIAFTGRLLKEKGIYELIAAVEKYNEVNDNEIYLFIAGEGDEKDYVEQHRSKFIIPIGRLNFEEIIALLKEADIFCLPSVSEGLATSALEAAACECFIITTKRGGTKELIKDEKYGIVMDDNSVENIYNAFKKALQNDDERIEAQKLCYAWLKQNFTWKTTTDNLEKIVLNNDRK